MNLIRIIVFILKLKCPLCGATSLFKNKRVYKYKNFFEMNDSCFSCHQNFIPELGFYYGAMYVSYALMTALMVVIFVVEYLLGIYSAINLISGIFILNFLLIPYLFKISRVIWLALMTSFKKK